MFWTKSSLRFQNTGSLPFPQVLSGLLSSMITMDNDGFLGPCPVIWVPLSLLPSGLDNNNNNYNSINNAQHLPTFSVCYSMYYILPRTNILVQLKKSWYKKSKVIQLENSQNMYAGNLSPELMLKNQHAILPMREFFGPYL